MSKVVEWNGQDVPTGLEGLPPGRYLIEPIDEVRSLSDEEEAGLRQALASVQRGAGVSLDEARAIIDRRLRR